MSQNDLLKAFGTSNGRSSRLSVRCSNKVKRNAKPTQTTPSRSKLFTDSYDTASPVQYNEPSRKTHATPCKDPSGAPCSGSLCASQTSLATSEHMYRDNSCAGNQLGNIKNSQKRRKVVQTFLDFGQQIVNHKTCPKCGMLYSFGLEEDDREHMRHCAASQKLLWSLSGSEDVVYIDSEGKRRCIEITRSVSSGTKRKWESISKVMQEDLGTGCQMSHISDRGLVLIGARNEVLGACIYRVLTTEVVMLYNQYKGSHQDNQFYDSETQICVGIEYIWTRSTKRRQGVATTLAHVALKRTAAKATTNVQNVLLAFSQPTRLGVHLLQKLCIDRGQQTLVYTDTK